MVQFRAAGRLIAGQAAQYAREADTLPSAMQFTHEPSGSFGVRERWRPLQGGMRAETVKPGQESVPAEGHNSRARSAAAGGCRPTRVASDALEPGAGGSPAGEAARQGRIPAAAARRGLLR